MVTTDRAALLAAIEAVEKAKCGDGMLDRQIQMAIEGWRNLGGGFREWIVDGRREPYNYIIPSPHYTTGLDAALTLVIKDWEYEISTLYGIARVRLPLNASVEPSEGERKDGNVPLAACLAALRARLAELEKA